ncbi:MAG: PKD domain-containing protein [Solirubrobacteraceae bacterium]|nr:PKD domain-containing protein [Solirubrobacteraceae bacterium]
MRGAIRLLLLCAAGICAAFPATAPAAVSDATSLDGPSPDVLEVGGAAMADDGTGGVVYRRRENGRAHVFVAVLRGGRWRGMQRIDVGQEFDSSWPRIAAASGGRLLVTWVQRIARRGTQNIDGMFAAWKSPGASRFSAPVPVDQNLGDSANAFPSLAMAANGGSAFLSYVTTRATQADGRIDAEFRLAQFRGGQRWSRMPSPRRSARLLRGLTAESAPKVVSDQVGNAVVAYIEPDDDDVDRVYARRIFSGDISLIPLQASPAEIDGVPAVGHADQFAVGIGGLGEAVVLLRQQRDQQGGGAALFANMLAPVFAEKASVFLGAREIELPGGGTANGLSAGTFAEGGAFRIAYGLGNTAVLGGGDQGGFRTISRFGSPGNIALDPPRMTIGPKGSGAVARRLSVDGADGVEVRELSVSGAARRAQVSAPGGGLVSDVEVGGSGLGDAIVALRSGSTSRGEIAAAVVDAPPLAFAVTAPTGWVRPSQARVGWEAARNAIGGIAYQLLLDGTPATDPQRYLGRLLPKRALDDGRHTVQVRATDTLGQSVLSNRLGIRIDGTPPKARIARQAGRRVRVTIGDAGRSGTDRELTKVLWGDGSSSEVKQTVVGHEYRKPGRYRVQAQVRDRAGNKDTVERTVVLR